MTAFPPGVGLNVVGACAASERCGSHRHSCARARRTGRPSSIRRSRRSTPPTPETSRSRRWRAFRSTRRSAARITVTATAIDVDRQPGSASPVAVFVRSANAAQPARDANGSAQERVLRLGHRPRHRRGHHDRRSDHSRFSTEHHHSARHRHAAGAVQRQRASERRARACRRHSRARSFGITAFAVDQAGRVGYAVPADVEERRKATSTRRLVDSTLVVYGRTYALPQQGTIGDIAVDATRGNVFLSNTAFNLLDVWQSSAQAKGFSPASIPVGSLPWGLSISNNPDTLLVANSGGTNISRVFIGSTDASSTPRGSSESYSHA